MPVPRHWSQKRKYLQGKRGLEKPPFVLPDYIEATGIGEMRKAYQDKVLEPLLHLNLVVACTCALAQAASAVSSCVPGRLSVGPLTWAKLI